MGRFRRCQSEAVECAHVQLHIYLFTLSIRLLNINVNGVAIIIRSIPWSFCSILSLRV